MGEPCFSEPVFYIRFFRIHERENFFYFCFRCIRNFTLKIGNNESVYVHFPAFEIYQRLDIFQYSILMPWAWWKITSETYLFFFPTPTIQTRCRSGMQLKREIKARKKRNESNKKKMFFSFDSFNIEWKTANLCRKSSNDAHVKRLHSWQ